MISVSIELLRVIDGGYAMAKEDISRVVYKDKRGREMDADDT